MPKNPFLAAFLLALSVALAVYLGFFAQNAQKSVEWFDHLGYAWVAGTFFLFCAFALWSSRGALAGFFKTFWQRPACWGAGAVIACASLYTIRAEARGFRVVMDEPVLLSTSYSMAHYQRTFMPTRAYTVDEHFWVMEPLFDKFGPNFVDKRSLLYPFLLSLVHNYKGFHSDNGFLLNGLLCPVFFTLLYVLLSRFLGLGAACAVVSLVAALPMLSWVTTGAGMDLVALIGALVVFLSLEAFFKTPTALASSTLCLSALIVAQTRYEMVLFIIPVGLALLWRWWQARAVCLSWVILLTPLLFVPYAWQQRILAENTATFQVDDALTLGLITQDHGAFSPHYLPLNVKNMLGFFFDLSGRMPSSAVLSFLGLVGVISLATHYVQRLRAGQGLQALSAPLQAWFFWGLGVLGILGLFLTYAWGGMCKPMTFRFSLLFSIAGLMAFGWFLKNANLGKGALWAACALGPLLAFAIHDPLRPYYRTHEPSFHAQALDFILKKTKALQEAELSQRILFLSEMTFVTTPQGYDSLNTGRAFLQKPLLSLFLKTYPQKPVYVFQIARYHEAKNVWTFLVDLQKSGFILRPLATLVTPEGIPPSWIHLSRLEGVILTPEEEAVVATFPTETDLPTRLSLLP